MQTLREVLVPIVDDEFQWTDSLLSTDSFFKYGIRENLVESLQGLGITTCSHIQTKMFAALAHGNTCIFAYGQSGSGKSLGALVSVLTRINHRNPSPQAVVICSTHEAAIQMSEIAMKLSLPSGISMATVVQSENVSLRNVEAQLIIGTPKEIVSFAIMRHFNIESIQILFIDDAEVVNTSDLVRKNITDKLNSSSVKIFTSLHPKPSAMTGQRFEIVSDLDLPNIKQTYMKCDSIPQKLHVISAAFKVLSTSFAQCIIFCRTRETIDFCIPILKVKGCTVTMIHSKMSVDERTAALTTFQSGRAKLLMCTNLLARGIDIPTVRMVINFDMPNDVKKGVVDKMTYKYRNGRTGRFGRPGLTLNLIGPEDAGYLEELGLPMTELRFETPTEKKYRH